MKHQYGEFDGLPFPTPDSLFPQPRVIEFILQYGQKALDAMDKLDNEEEQAFIQEMIDAGLLERDEKTGKLKLTPRMLRGIEHRALLDMLEGLARPGNREGHATLAAGRSDDRATGTRPYEFGDPISEIDLGATMRNALHRRSREAQGEQSDETRLAGAIGRLNIRPDDFELHISEGQTDLALCVLLDMSGSMMRYGRFYQAKRVAMGLKALMRRRFPQDSIDFVGFYSLAKAIKESELPLVMPKPVSLYDPSVRVRVRLEQAHKNEDRLPLHFTNLQLGMRMARQMLSRRGAMNKQLFIITDGQPTAHVEPGPDGQETLHLIYPPGQRTTDATLAEAMLCMRQGIRVATFALVEDYWGMEWVGFVDQLTRLTRGTAYYCSSDDLSSTIIESYLSGKRKKTAIA